MDENGNPKADPDEVVGRLLALAADAGLHLQTAEQLRQQIIVDSVAKHFAGVSK